MDESSSAYGNCCYDHQSAGCDSAWPTIQTCVCDKDPFCCGNNFGYTGGEGGHWDGACVELANNCGPSLPTEVAWDGSSNLCFDNAGQVCTGGGTGSNDGNSCTSSDQCDGWCEAMDPCQSSNPPMWCGNYTGTQELGDCCEQTWGMPGCNSGTDADSDGTDDVQECVCAKDSYCCQVEWDGPCVNLGAFCGAVCTFDDPCAGDYPPAHCYGDDAEDFDPCDAASYEGDAAQIPDYCTTYGGGSEGECCAANTGQGCTTQPGHPTTQPSGIFDKCKVGASHKGPGSDTWNSVCECVCADDPWCCGAEAESPGEGEWDLVCVKMAHDCMEAVGEDGCFETATDPCAPDSETGTVPFWCEDEDDWEMEADDNPCWGDNPAPWCNMWGNATGSGSGGGGSGGGGSGGGGSGGGPTFQGGGGWTDTTTAVDQADCCTNTFGTPGCDSGSSESASTTAYLVCKRDTGEYDKVCEAVCAADNYCCNYEWDPPCVSQAAGQGFCADVVGYEDPCGGMNPKPWCGDSDDFDVPDEYDPCQGTDPPDWCWADADPCAVTNPPDWCFDETEGGDWDACMASCLPICYGMGGNTGMCEGMCDDKCGGSADPCDGENPPAYCSDYEGGPEYDVGTCSGGNHEGAVCTTDVQCGTGATCEFPDDGGTNTETDPCDICINQCVDQGGTESACDMSCEQQGECATGGSDNTGGYCGDGQVGDGEECDDGNTANNDGCNSYCMAEGGGGSDPCDTCIDTCQNQGQTGSYCDAYCAGYCTGGFGAGGGSY